MSVSERYQLIQDEIKQVCKRVKRNPDDIEIIAVTKYVSNETAQEAIDAGVQHLGENRLEGFMEKYESIGQAANFHFIGTLQSRKVKDLIDYVDSIHSLDRKSLAKEINKRASREVSCFVQVNTSDEESKHGIKPEEVVPFIESLANYPNVKVVGLMTMAPLTDDEQYIRQCFRKLREVSDEVQRHQFSYAPCDQLSMGMSNDYQIAIEEGATHIRIGSKLVGKEV
ncbi:YggS family pyridoxal phosphate-dependent enzyme [Alkalibacillus haloalkaliphilus]|uniref:Pyridoxal phosphate homeostasis protein n=1 Tax=Alkalibacillus haloalkaliphilus TaxID=94136 RepID=A0A511W640_9BACI|nr:YggS family pyridoxal phosphate-dependent enzyme [Alkalibacillus haloalkaliphilus]GEN44832.1 YggS family pyridoxal phosphate enzyme [Alkalibacillus haloalkaliphilus]